MTSSRTPSFGPGAGGGDDVPSSKAARGRRTASRQARIGGMRTQRGGGQAARAAGSWRVSDELAEAITARCGTMVATLHRRQTPGGRLALDHLLVAPSGVWVVRSGRHNGRVDVTHPTYGRPRLTIGGTDRTDLIDELDQQVDAVNQAMVRIDPRIAVRGALCIITPKGLLHEAGLPVIRPLEIRGYPVAPPKRITRLLTADDAIVRLPPMERTRMARALAQRFPAQAGPARPRP